MSTAPSTRLFQLRTENPDQHSERTTGFFTDSTLCIGCKACEVACKEWNDVPMDGLNWSGFSYDNTGSLSYATWRHVKFVEGQIHPGEGGNSPDSLSWEFSSDVCKHCEVAGCMEACPTGRARPHRIRLRLSAARRLQRLRLLRRLLPLRSGSTQSRRWSRL